MPKTSKIVAATGTASGSSGTSIGKRIEAAMAEAVLQAAKDGISADKPDQVREYMMAARARVKAEHQAELAAQEVARRKAQEVADKAFADEMAKHSVGKEER